MSELLRNLTTGEPIGLDPNAVAQVRPVLTTAQSQKIEQYISEFVRRAAGASEADATRILRNRAWNLGDQYTTIDKGRLVRAPETGTVRGKLNYVSVLNTLWASILARGPVFMEATKAMRDVDPAMVDAANALLRDVSQRADLVTFWSRFAFEVARDGERYAIVEWDTNAGLITKKASQNGTQNVTDGGGLYQRSGGYSLESASTCEVLCEPSVSTIDKSPMLVRVMRVTIEEARRQFGDAMQAVAGSARSDQMNWRMTPQFSDLAWRDWLGVGTGATYNDKSVLITDCWIRPETVRAILGPVPGCERGLRRIRCGSINALTPLGTPSTRESSLLSQQNYGSLADTYWPPSALALNQAPFAFAMFEGNPDTLRGRGIADMVEELQTELNLYKTGTLSSAVFELIMRTKLAVPESERSQMQNFKLQGREPVYFNQKAPERIQTAGLPSEMVGLIDATLAQMERRCYLVPSDFGRSPEDARAVNATALEIEQEQASYTKGPVIQRYNSAVARIGTHLLQDAVCRLTSEQWAQYANDNDQIANQIVALGSMMAQPFYASISDKNTQSPIFMRARIIDAQKAGANLAPSVVRAALIGPNDDALGTDYGICKRHAQQIAQALKQWDVMDEPERASYMPPQPVYAQGPDGNPVMVMNPETGMGEPQIAGYVVTMPSGVVFSVGDYLEGTAAAIEVAYDPETWVVPDPYITESSALVNNLQINDMPPDQQQAIRWYAEQARSLSQIQSQVVEQTRMEMRKQGMSDKGLEAQIASNGTAA